MLHDNVNGKVNGDLISRRKLDGMRLAVPDFVNPDQRTKGWNECITYIQQKAPAVDAVPVVHARYVYYDGYAIPNCSACGCSIADIEWAFCPHCGAMLDESGETK